MRPIAVPLLLLALAAPAAAGSCAIERQAYAPRDDLEAIDVELIDRAQRRIDMAAYVLTSLPVVEALDRAAARGVLVRLYRDGRETRVPRRLAEAFDRLAARPTAEIRYKGEPAPLMHLKSYAIDGALVRDGAGNFSRSGLRSQDNSLIALRCAEAAARFGAVFEAMWRR